MKDPRFPKSLVFINALAPLGILGWDAFWHQLGADPVKSSIHITGTLALVFLLLSLAVTPLRLISGWNWLSHFRRMLGLYAFFYACVHLSIYFTWDRGGSISSLITETAKRPFILYGMSALVMMLPLAITSTNGMIKRLGSARWKLLHRLAYPAGIAGVVHFWYSTKLVSMTQQAFAVVLTLLLLYRMALRFFPVLKYTPPRRAARDPVPSAAGRAQT